MNASFLHRFPNLSLVFTSCLFLFCSLEPPLILPPHYPNTQVSDPCSPPSNNTIYKSMEGSSLPVYRGENKSNNPKLRTKDHRASDRYAGMMQEVPALSLLHQHLRLPFPKQPQDVRAHRQCHGEPEVGAVGGQVGKGMGSP